MKKTIAVLLWLTSCVASAGTMLPFILSGSGVTTVSYGQTTQVFQSGQNWNPSTYTVSNVQTGDTIVVMGGWWSTRTAGTLLPPTDNNGTFTKGIDNGVPTSAPGQPVETVIYYELNAASGTHVITPPNIGGNADSDGTLYIILFRGIKTSSALRATGATHTGNGTGIASVTVSLSSNAAVGDLVVATAAYDNTVIYSGGAGFTDPPANWASRGVQQDAVSNVPGEACSRIAAAATNQSVTWTWNDPNVNVVDAAIMALIPN